MKPLVLWARDKHPAPYVLRISERLEDELKGAVKIDGIWLPFSFDQRKLEIKIGTEPEARLVTINEWGWEQ